MYTEVTMVYPGRDSRCLQRIPFVHKEKISKKLCEMRQKRNSPIRWNPSKLFQQEMTQNFKIAVIENQVLQVTFGFEKCIIWQLKTKDLIIDNYGNYRETTLYAIGEENRKKGYLQDWELVHDYQIRDIFGVYDYFCAKSGIFNGMGVSINGVFVQTLESFREQIFNWLPVSSELKVDKKLLFNSNGEKEIEIELDEAAIRRNLKSQKNPKKYKSIWNSMEKLDIDNLDTFCDIIIQTMYSEIIPMVENTKNGDLIEIQRYFKEGKVHDEFILPLEIKRGGYHFKASIACIPQRDENDTVYGIVDRAVNPAFVTMSNVALAHENGEVPIRSWVSQMEDNRHCFKFFEQVKKQQSLQLQLQQSQSQQSRSVSQHHFQQQQQQQQQWKILIHTQSQQGQHGGAPSQQVYASTLAFMSPQFDQADQGGHGQPNQENGLNTPATSGVRTVDSTNRFGQLEAVIVNLDGVDEGKNERKENNVYIGNVLLQNDRNRRINKRRMKFSVLNNKEYGERRGQAPKTVKKTKEYLPETKEEIEKNKTNAGRNKTKNTTKNVDNIHKQSSVESGAIATPASKELEREVLTVLAPKSELLKISNVRIDNKILSSEDGIGRMRNGGDNNDDDATKEKEKKKKKKTGNSNAVQQTETNETKNEQVNVEEKNLEEKENINNFNEIRKKKRERMNTSQVTVQKTMYKKKIDSYESYSCPFSRSPSGGLCRVRLLVTSQVLPQEMALGLNEKLKDLQDEKTHKDRNTFGCDATLRRLKRKLQERDAGLLTQIPVELGPILTAIQRRGNNRKKINKMKKVNRIDKDDQLIMKLMASIVSVESGNKGKTMSENENGIVVGAIKRLNVLRNPLANNYCSCDDNEMNDTSSSAILDGIKRNKRNNSKCSHSGSTSDSCDTVVKEVI